MLKPYKLLILGYPVQKIEDINHCFSMLTYGLETAFKKLPHVTLHRGNIINPQKHYNSLTCAQYDYEKIPNVDFIIGINYTHFFTKENYIELKTKCNKFISFLEVAQRYCDLSFVFRPPLKEWKRVDTLISHPYSPEFYTTVSKQHNTILLDHIYYERFIANDSSMEWSRRLWEWLDKIQTTYKIYSLISIPKNSWADIHLKNLPSYITPIYATNFIDYLDKTKTFENFIVTHKGSYNFSIFDMLLRGIRVFAPRKFMCADDITAKFDIGQFSTSEELINLLNKPINKNVLNFMYKKCTPMNEVARLIDSQLQRWL